MMTTIFNFSFENNFWRLFLVISLPLIGAGLYMVIGIDRVGRRAVMKMGRKLELRADLDPMVESAPRNRVVPPEHTQLPEHLHQLANVNTPDARTLSVQPWEKSVLAAIARAIINSNLGFNPSNDGHLIRINIPPLTEERRKDLVKRAKSEGEHAKVSIRSARRDVNEECKKLQKDGLPEDMIKDAEAKVQQMTDKMIAKVDEVLATKEKEIMTV